MAVLASDVLTRARSTLLDAGKVAWSDAELISYLNSGMTQVVSLKPNAYPKAATLTLAAGVAQALPADGVMFLDCSRNGDGNMVTVTNVHEIARVHVNWAAEAPSSPLCVMLDPRFPRIFYVYPPSPASHGLPVVYGAIPPRVAVLSDPISLVDTYETALWAFVCSMAYAKNSKRQDFAKADEMMKLFTQTVTGNVVVERATTSKPDIKGEQ